MHNEQSSMDQIEMVAETQEKTPNKTREKKGNTLSLEAYDLYIFLPLWQQVTKKFIENA